MYPAVNDMEQTSQTFIAFYDLEVTPTAYDAAHYTSLALGAFNQSGCEHLHFVIVPDLNDGCTGPRKAGYSPEQADARIRNIVIPCLTTFCREATCTVLKRRSDATRFIEQENALIYPESYSLDVPITRYRNIEFLANDSIAFAPLTPPKVTLETARKWLHKNCGQRKAITITLRQSPHNPSRNSDLDAWLSFARSLDPSEYCPVFIPDTETFHELDEAFNDFVLCSEACFSLELRAAVYQEAHCNLFVSNGPAALCYLNPRCRFLNFRIISPGNHAASLHHLAIDLSFRPGRHWPKATQTQRFIWEEDSAKAIERSFQLWEQSALGSLATSAQPLIEQAKRELASGNSAAAQTTSALAVAFHSESPEAWTTRISILEETGRSEEAFFQNEEAISRFAHPRFLTRRLELVRHVKSARLLHSIVTEFALNHPQANWSSLLDLPTSTAKTESGWQFAENATAPSRKLWIFGAGTAGKGLFAYLDHQVEVLGFIDNSAAGEGPRGKPLILPSAIGTVEPAHITIASSFDLEILIQLYSLGIHPTRIDIYDTSSFQ